MNAKERETVIPMVQAMRVLTPVQIRAVQARLQAAQTPMPLSITLSPSQLRVLRAELYGTFPVRILRMCIQALRVGWRDRRASRSQAGA